VYTAGKRWFRYSHDIIYAIYTLNQFFEITILGILRYYRRRHYIHTCHYTHVHLVIINSVGDICSVIHTYRSLHLNVVSTESEIDGIVMRSVVCKWIRSPFYIVNLYYIHTYIYIYICMNIILYAVLNERVQLTKKAVGVKVS